MADRGADRAERRRTLWILNHYALPPGEGASTRHHDLGQELTRRGWQVVIFAAAFNHFTGRARHLGGRRLSRAEAHGDVRFIWLRTLPYRGNGARRVLNMLSYCLVVLLVAAGVRPRPDAIIGSTVHPFAALAGWLLARGFGAKFLFEIRDLWPQSLIDMGAWRAGNPAVRLLRRLEAFLVARADTVISLLPGIEPYLAAHGERPRALTYVPNGVRLDQPDVAQRLPAAVEAVLDRWGDAFVVGYTGAHGVNNGLGAVLEAAARLEAERAPVAFVLVGDGPEKGTLQARARRLGLERLAFLDPVPKAAIPALLRRFDAGLMTVLPSPVHQYGVSFNKVFDYMANRLPVVFACTTPYDPVAEAGAGVSVAPGEGQQLAAAILQLARADEATRAEMGRRGRAYVASHHDITRLAERLDQALEGAADRDGPQGVNRPYPGKRLVDLGMLLLVVVPATAVGVVCALAVRLTSPGPILFRQTRVGMAGRSFEIVKFRTMIDAPDNPLVPAADRITSAGRWLRRLSLDEVPQLINVFRGEMSIVGPRPALAYQVERYTERQRGRLAVRPGVTGLAQVSGRNTLRWADRIELDLEYVARQSPLLDLRILGRTLAVVVRGSGVEGHPLDDELAAPPTNEPGGASPGSPPEPRGGAATP